VTEQNMVAKRTKALALIGIYFFVEKNEMLTAFRVKPIFSAVCFTCFFSFLLLEDFALLPYEHSFP